MMVKLQSHVPEDWELIFHDLANLVLGNCVISLIMSKYSDNNDIPLEWFVTSRIIQLKHTRKEDTIDRTIQVTKMLGIK